MVGRACLGRPWLFSDLAAMFAGRYPGPPPALAQAVAAMREHLLRWAAHEGSATSAVLKMRKLVPLYLQVRAVGAVGLWGCGAVGLWGLCGWFGVGSGLWVWTGGRLWVWGCWCVGVGLG
jgi:hypothetical protein